MKFTMSKIAASAASAALGLASTAALAVPVSSGGVFDMYSPKGLDQAPETLVGPINVDSTITAFVDQSAGTWGVASATPFFGLNWTASGGTLVTTAGDYVLNTTTGAISAAAPDSVGTADGMMHFTVGAGQVAGAINFAWGATTGIRVVNVWTVNGNGSLTAAMAPGMENGPFPGFNAAFNLSGGAILPLDCPPYCGDYVPPDPYVPPGPEASTYSMMLAGLVFVWGATRRRILHKRKRASES